MTFIFRWFSVIFSVVALAGCAGQKTALSDARPTESVSLHRQALQALEDRNFIIKADEFFLPGKDPVSSHDSYISMQGNRGVTRYSLELFPYMDYSRLNIEDDAAELTKKKNRKNGDVEFKLKIVGELKNWLNGNLITVTLYKNSNKCSVRVDIGRESIRFTGNIFPLSE